jgi:hypothetical protein
MGHTCLVAALIIVAANEGARLGYWHKKYTSWSQARLRNSPPLKKLLLVRSYRDLIDRGGQVG